MKQIETSKFRKYTAVMILCFLFGGFNIIFSIFSLTNGVATISSELNSTKNQGLPPTNIRYLLISSISVVTLVTGIILILSGVSIMFLIRQKTENRIKKNITEKLLSSDEKLVLNYLNSKKGESTQKDITLNTNLSKVKVSRIIKSLESKKLLIKHKYGMTNKIILK